MVVTCLDDKRNRLLEAKYNQFVQRYNPEYAENARALCGAIRASGGDCIVR